MHPVISTYTHVDVADTDDPAAVSADLVPPPMRQVLHTVSLRPPISHPGIPLVLKYNNVNRNTLDFSGDEDQQESRSTCSSTARLARSELTVFSARGSPHVLAIMLLRVRAGGPSGCNAAANRVPYKPHDRRNARASILGTRNGEGSLKQLACCSGRPLICCIECPRGCWQTTRKLQCCHK
jgi:hypothetical protein